MWSAIRGEEVAGRTLFWEREGNSAVREGRWCASTTGWERYDMGSDRAAQHDGRGLPPE